MFDRKTTTADTVRDRFEDVGEIVSESAKEQAERARPHLKRWREQAADAAKQTAEDLRRLGSEAREASADVTEDLMSLGIDMKDAGRREADRVIAAIEASAEQARAEAEEREHRRRVRALVGWTAFGMVAGAVLTWRLTASDGEDPIESASADASTDASTDASNEYGEEEHRSVVR